MKSNKQLYREICERENSISLFSKDWWLDATAGPDHWDVALVLKNGEVLAALPFMYKKKYGFSVLTQPPLTQTLGPWFRGIYRSSSKNLAIQKDLMEALIDQLPPFDRYSQCWSWQVSNWLPFYWRGFRQTLLYTYVLDDIADTAAIWDGLQGNIRTDIRKAESRHGLKIRCDLPIEDFLKLNSMTFSRQKMKSPIPEEFIKRLDLACSSRNARKIFIAEDESGRHHAGVYVVWDSNSAYYLMGGGNPALRNSGATSLCMWEAIKFSSTVTRRFDFEGSMIESVERFFRAFGAIQTPYFSVHKTNSIALKSIEFLRNLRR